MKVESERNGRIRGKSKPDVACRSQFRAIQEARETNQVCQTISRSNYSQRAVVVFDDEKEYLLVELVVREVEVQ